MLLAESITILRNSAGGIDDLTKRRSQKVSCGLTPRTYSPQLRSFALTLHCYSPHAYRYARDTFVTCLLHPQTTVCFHTTDGRPGFTKEAFDTLKVCTASSAKLLVCVLMTDEVVICQQLEYKQKLVYTK